MYLPYKAEITNKKELTANNFRYPNFIGYLSPTGEVLKVTPQYGHGNDLTTELFKTYFTERYYTYKIDEIKFHIKEKQDECEREMMSVRKQELLSELNDKIKIIKKQVNNNEKADKWDILDKDILSFFSNCYLNEQFSIGYGRSIIFKDKYLFANTDYRNTYNKKVKEYPKKHSESDQSYAIRIPISYTLDYQYSHYLDNMYSELIKETLAMYMGYHIVERTYKTITTSARNIYETFYNYLLNDYTIYQLPQMIFDETKKTYIEHNIDYYYLSSKEQKLKMELNSIKKLVKKEDIHKYYR